MTKLDLKSDTYKPGFQTKVRQKVFKKGLNEEVIRSISQKKKEPNWLLDFRLKAFKKWQSLTEPHWAELDYPPIDYQKISYFAELDYNSFSGKEGQIQSLDELDPEIKKTFDRLGIPIFEQKKLAGVAMDVIFDSVSIKTTFQKELNKLGIIFCPFSEAAIKHSNLVKKYLALAVPSSDNFFACLNSCVFSEGTFVYIPKGVSCPMELSSYFRLNASEVGQFERTLIIADKGSSVRYLEGCTAPQRDHHQLHAAVVEIVALDEAKVEYSTIQNWYPGSPEGKGGVYNFVTKRGLCEGQNSQISWTQLETGSAITWKYPSVILKGDNSSGSFYSVAVTNNFQQADTGTKMIHLGKNTKSRIVSKSISAGHSKNTFRSLVKIAPKAESCRNFSQCDSLLLSEESQTFTLPTIQSSNFTAILEQEATSGKLSQDTLFYLKTRGLNLEKASSLLISGFCSQVLENLPFEFAVEAKKLLEISLEGAVG